MDNTSAIKVSQLGEFLGTVNNISISGDGVNSPLGIDTSIYTPYNETVIWQKPSTGWFTGTKITFSEPISSFQRLMFIHANDECPLVKFYGIPYYSDSYFLFEASTSNSTASKAIRFSLYKMNGWSEMNFSAQLSMAKITNTTAVETYANYTGTPTAAYQLNGYLSEIRGINRKV